MEQSVNGIRDKFYPDLTSNYNDKGENSLLYRFTWEESAVELLKKLKKKYKKFFSEISTQAPQTPEKFMACLKDAMEARTKEEIRELLEQEFQQERRDFWQQLWLRDAFFRTKWTSGDSGDDYCLWLVKYLTMQDKYYRESCPAMVGEGELLEELYRLVREGLRDTEWAPKPGRLRGTDGKIRKSKLGAYLSELEKLLQDQQDAGKAEVAGRLRKLGCLSRLWKLLERKSLHIKIKTWFQDSGFPLRYESDNDPSDGDRPPEAEEGKKKKIREYPSPKGDRKQDFTMRLFAAYCDSPDGYDFFPKGLGGAASRNGWHLEDNGFCVLDAGQIDRLVSALKEKAEERKSDNYYVPLAVHLYSGCVFFLAGSSVYEDVYPYSKTSELAAKYRAAKKRGRFCFDYLRLDDGYWDGFQAVGKEFQILPVFHENLGKSYDDVLADFKRYCMEGEESILEAVRNTNEDCTDNTPAMYRWAFNGVEDYEPSQDATDEFNKSQNKQKRDSRGIPL